jgi:hypothetical protein
METTMAQWGLGIELNGAVNHLRVYPRDWEVCIGGWTVTVLWWGLGRHDGGFYLNGPNTEVHWCWDHILQRVMFWRGWKVA